MLLSPETFMNAEPDDEAQGDIYMELWMLTSSSKIPS
jgi:hypothetical protein